MFEKIISDIKSMPLDELTKELKSFGIDFVPENHIFLNEYPGNIKYTAYNSYIDINFGFWTTEVNYSLETPPSFSLRYKISVQGDILIPSMKKAA